MVLICDGAGKCLHNFLFVVQKIHPKTIYQIDKILLNLNVYQYQLFFNRQLITIGILEPLAGDVIMDLIHQKIETEVQEITKENFGEHHISALEKVVIIISMY